MSKVDPESFDYPVFVSQGLALVREERQGDRVVHFFIEDPDPCFGLKNGDQVPEDWNWSYHPANQKARDLVDLEQFGPPVTRLDVLKLILAHADPE